MNDINPWQAIIVSILSMIAVAGALLAYILILAIVDYLKKLKGKK